LFANYSEVFVQGYLKEDIKMPIKKLTPKLTKEIMQKDGRFAPLVPPEMFVLPANTCPLIDAVQAILRKATNELEPVREANESLREACHNYHRVNQHLTGRANELLAEAALITKHNKELLAWLEHIASTSESEDKKQLAIAKKELIHLQNKFEDQSKLYGLIDDLICVGRRMRTKFAFDTALDSSTKDWLVARDKQKKVDAAKLYASALAKLSSEELTAVRQANLDAETEEED
jgi:hypothetical protein